MRRAMAYGDDSEKLLVWYDVEDMLGKMQWIIPETSPWVNSRKWRNEYRVSPTPKIKNSGRGGIARGSAPRGSAPRGNASRGRVYTQTQRGVMAAKIVVTPGKGTSNKILTGANMKVMTGNRNPHAQGSVGPQDQPATQGETGR